MNDPVDTLDRRAARMRADIDAALEGLDTPAWHIPSPGDRRPDHRRLLAAAASVVVLAMISGVVVVVLSRGGRDSVATDGPGLTYLAIPDPEAVGLGLFVALDASNPDTSAPPYTGLTESLGRNPDVTIHGPETTADPWTSAVIDVFLPPEVVDPPPDGEPVDLGGTNGIVGAYRASGTPAVVEWETGGGRRQLTSQSVDRDELVAVARQIVAAGTGPGEPIPGRELLFTGRLTDVVPLTAFDHLTGLEYQTDPSAWSGEEGGSFVIGPRIDFSRGSDARWRAATIWADETTSTTVRGRPATLAWLRDVTYELSWLEEDGTLVRFHWRSDGDPTWGERIANLLEPIGEDEFQALVKEHPYPEPTPQGWDPELGGETGQVVPSVGVDHDGIGYRTLISTTEQGFRLEVIGNFDSETADRTGQAVPDGATSIGLLLTDHPVVGGLVGQGLEALEVYDTATGARVPVAEWAVSNWGGEDRDVFVAVLDVDPGEVPASVDIVGTLGDGTEVRITTDR